MSETMTDQEKSAALARLCGWESVMTSFGHPCWWYGGSVVYSGSRYNGAAFEPLDLYDPANMALAAKVVLWAFETVLKDNSDEHRWLFAYNFLKDTRTALNNILKLAIAAGMVTE